MALTPVEIRHITPPRTNFRGYRIAPTDKLLEDIAASFEDVWRERADLADKVEQLESDLVRFREEVITRRTKFELAKARDRAHILLGLVIAVTNLDEVVRLIRSSASPASAVAGCWISAVGPGGTR